MSLPNIIAGPILRRVDKDSVSVWIACTKNVHLILRIYAGDGIKMNASVAGKFPKTSGSPVEVETDPDIPAEATTVQFGKNLWIAVVTAKFKSPALQSKKIYSYNVQFEDMDAPGSRGDLKTDGLLSDKHLGVKQEPLGYDKNTLPTFVLPGDDPAELIIAQASCRKMHGHGPDALAYLDKVIGDNRTKLETRPQQLFLTGDQVYADDVPGPLLRLIGVHSGNSIGLDETVKIKRSNGKIKEVEADIINFPPYLRQRLLTENAGFSSGSASNHVISFGEFCALYLNYWSLRSWHPELIGILGKIQEDNKDSVLAREASNLLDSTAVEHDPNLKSIYEDREGVRSPLFKLHFDAESKARYELKPVTVKSPAKQQERFDKWLEKIRTRLKNDLKEMAEFTRTLPKVSRVLANIPSYMIFDDHEITDDWFLSQRWKNHVLSRPLGRDIIRNGMMAYAVFQDWGNVPDEYVAIEPRGGDSPTPRTQLLRKIQDYAFFRLSDSFSSSDRDAVNESVERMLGLGDQAATVKWHYTVNSGPSKAFVLDTRTRREYESLNSPPGLLNEAALEEQIPGSIPGGDAPFTFIISPAPVLGISSFEELIQPAAAAVTGISSTTGRNPGFLAGMLKRDYEAWGMSPKAFEALVERMSKLKRVIILSGDVHYGFSSMLDYWQGSANTPAARLVQFTSSALKNEEFGVIHLYRSAIAQKLITGIGDRLEKLGWKNRVLSVNGEVSIRNRQRLRQNPAVIPVAGWQVGATVNRQPDYRWRLNMISDNSVRTPNPFPADLDPENDASMREGYKKVVQHHQETFFSGVHRRMVWPSNIGILRFEKESGSGEWQVKHDFLFVKGTRTGPDENPGTHIKHEASLVANGPAAVRPRLPG